jgi:hypothetical protein
VIRLDDGADPYGATHRDGGEGRPGGGDPQAEGGAGPAAPASCPLAPQEALVSGQNLRGLSQREREEFRGPPHIDPVSAHDPDGQVRVPAHVRAVGLPQSGGQDLVPPDSGGIGTGQRAGEGSPPLRGSTGSVTRITRGPEGVAASCAGGADSAAEARRQQVLTKATSLETPPGCGGRRA